MSARLICFVLVIFQLSLASCVEHSRDAMHSLEITVDNDQALEYLTGLAEDEPDNPEVYYQLSRVYFAEANYSYALKTIQKAIAIKEDNPEYFYLEGQIYQKLNQPNEAIKALLLAESLGKKNHNLYKMVAEEHLRLGQSDKAREAINRLTSMKQTAESYTLRGNIMLALGDTMLAVRNYKGAMQLDSNYYQPYIAMADISLSEGDGKNASLYVNKLVSLQPDNPDFLERHADLLQRNGNVDSAKQVFQKLIDIRGNYLDYYRLSNAYYLLRAYDSAQLMANRAFEMNEHFLDAQIVVARSLDKSRKYQQAIGVYEGIIDMDSTHNLAITELANLKRKVAYLWRLRQQRMAQDSASQSAPPPVEKKEIDDNQK